MGRKRELAKNTAILTFGKVCTQFINFFLLPLYTAILTTEEYGTFDLVITYSTLLLPLVNWQLDQGLFRFMLDSRDDKWKQISLFSSSIASSTAQVILYILLFLIVEPFLKIENSHFLLVYVILNVFTALLMQFVRGLGFNVKYAVASFISATCTTVTNVIALVLLKLGLQGLFLSTVFSQAITLIYLLISSRCWEYFNFKALSFKTLKEVFSFSIPLIPNNIAWWIVSASDRTIISYVLGTAANGVYSVAAKFPNMFINLYNILNLSWTETVSLHYKDVDRDAFLSETMTSLLKLFSSACFGIVACMPFVFPLMVNKSYNAAYNQILIMMYAMLLRVLVGLFSCVYVAQKKSKKIAITSMSVALINVSVNLIFINKIGLYAASISTFVAFGIMFLIRYIDVNRTISMKIKKPVVLAILIMGIALAFSYYSKNITIQFIALLITIVYAVVFNIDLIKSMLKMISTFLKKIKAR